MSFAPYGVFALLATLIVEAPKWDLLKSLLLYSITLIIGLFSLISNIYNCSKINSK